MALLVEPPADDDRGLEAQRALGHLGMSSVLVAIQLRNLPSQKPWE